MWSSHSKNAIYRDMSSTYICKYTINTSTRDNKFSHWKQKQYQFCHIYQINHTWMLLTVSTLTTLTTRPHRSGSIVTTRLSTLSTRNASTLDKMTLPSGFFMATNNNHNNYRHGHFCPWLYLYLSIIIIIIIIIININIMDIIALWLLHHSSIYYLRVIVVPAAIKITVSAIIISNHHYSSWIIMIMIINHHHHHQDHHDHAQDAEPSGQLVWEWFLRLADCLRHQGSFSQNTHVF